MLWQQLKQVSTIPSCLVSELQMQLTLQVPCKQKFRSIISFVAQSPVSRDLAWPELSVRSNDIVAPICLSIALILSRAFGVIANSPNSNKVY